MNTNSDNLIAVPDPPSYFLIFSSSYFLTFSFSHFVFAFLVRKAKAENFPVNNNTEHDIKSTGIKIRSEIISTIICSNKFIYDESINVS